MRQFEKEDTLKNRENLANFPKMTRTPQANETPKPKSVHAQIAEGNPTYKELAGRTWRLAWPAVGEQMLNQAVNVANVFFMGHLSLQAAAFLGYSSAEALTAVAISGFMNWCVLVVYMSLGIAATALVARAIGAKEYQRGRDIARQAMVMALILGLITTVVVFFGAEIMMRIYGGSETVVALGTRYLHIMAISLTFSALLFVGNSCLRASGDTRTPLIFIGLTNLITICVGAVLVNGGFGLTPMGVDGAAIGMICGWSIGGTLVTLRLLGLLGRKRYSAAGTPALYIRERGKPLSWRLEKATYDSVVTVGLPTLGENMIFQLGILLFGRMVVGLGTTKYAAFNLSVTIDSWSFMPGQALGIAATVLIGQCLGARRFDLAVQYVKVCVAMGVSFMLTLGLTFVLFPRFYLGLLASDAAVVDAAVDALRVGGFFSPVIGFMFIMLGVLRGAGDTRFPLIGRVMSTLGVRLGVAFLTINILGLGLIGSRMAMGLDALLLGSLLVWRFSRGNWKTAIKDKPVYNQPPEPATIPVASKAAEVEV